MAAAKNCLEKRFHDVKQELNKNKTGTKESNDNIDMDLESFIDEILLPDQIFEEFKKNHDLSMKKVKGIISPEYIQEVESQVKSLITHYFKNTSKFPKTLPYGYANTSPERHILTQCFKKILKK